MHDFNYKRDIIARLLQRIHEPRRFIQVITGSRQVGKTTAVQQVLNEWRGAFQYSTAETFQHHRNRSGSNSNGN